MKRLNVITAALTLVGDTIRFSFGLTVSVLFLFFLPALAANETDTPPGAIKLLPGYKHKTEPAIETHVGKIWKGGGLTIRYDIGSLAGQYVKPAERSNYAWYKEQALGKQKVRCALTKEGQLIVTFPDTSANFSALVKTPEDIADVLLMVLTYHGQSKLKQIMSFKKYQSITHSEPYLYQLQADSGALLYFGSHHSFDPTDPQMDKIEQAWNAFKPDVAYTEGGKLSLDSLTLTQAIERYGEFGMTEWMARRDGVPVRSLDPSRESEIAYLKEKGWSDEQLMLFYTLRHVAQSQKQPATVDLTVAVPRYLKSLVQRFNLQGPTTLTQFEEAVGRLLPDVENWKTLSMSYFYPGPQEKSDFTNEIATDSNRFRDLYHVNLLKKAVLSGSRAFAIAGSAHAVMQEPALRAVLQSR